MDNVTRSELFECYCKLDESYNTIKRILREEGGIDYERARAYWLGYLDQAVSCEDTFSGVTSFKDYLLSNGIIDDCGEFIEEEDEEDEDCEED